MRIYSYQSNTVRDQVEYIIKTFSITIVQDKKARRRLLRKSLTFVEQPFQILWRFFQKWTTVPRWSQEPRHQITAKGARQPGNERDTSNKIRMGPQNQVTQKEPSSYADNFGASSENIAQTKSQRETLKNIAEPSRDYPDHTPLRSQSKKYPRSWTKSYKTKIKPDGNMPTVIYISGKYGRISRLTYQTQ